MYNNHNNNNHCALTLNYLLSLLLSQLLRTRTKIHTHIYKSIIILPLLSLRTSEQKKYIKKYIVYKLL